MRSSEMNHLANWLLDAREAMDKVDSVARVEGATAAFVKAIEHPTATAYTINGSANGLMKTVEAMRVAEINDRRRRIDRMDRPDTNPGSAASH